MDPWSSSYQSYGGGGRGGGGSGGDDGLGRNSMETVTVGKTNGNRPMFVGYTQSRRSRPRTDIKPPTHSAKSSKKSSSGSWWNDPEMKRKRRVAKYKLYSAEGKLKASLKHGFRWFKRKCSQIARSF